MDLNFLPLVLVITITCPCIIGSYRDFSIEISEAKNENSVGFFFHSFHVFTQNKHCGYTLEPPLRGVSNEYPQCMF